jgi:acetate kinase
VFLAVNTGSSSVRLSWFEGRRCVSRQRLEGHPDPASVLRGDAEVVVHRVVHGGDSFRAPVDIDAAAEAAIEALVPLAPLHQPEALRWIRGARAAFPKARQVAVFDTAFFSALPVEARTYALPDLGVRRYGFHGLAHAAMWRALGVERGRAITLQLGAGCSASAIRDGRPIDTSMGMTPLEGLVMATRPGDLDPGIVLELVQRGLDVGDLLSHRSGLLGLSGESGDLRALLASPSERARLAVAVYVLRIKKYVGAYLALLGGADAIVFSGGVGEHQPPIRRDALAGLEPLGITVDDARNRAAVGVTARIDAGGPVAVWVAAGDEEAEMVSQALGPAG